VGIAAQSAGFSAVALVPIGAAFELGVIIMWGRSDFANSSVFLRRMLTT
jgi:hypothetical protein